MGLGPGPWADLASFGAIWAHLDPFRPIGRIWRIWAHLGPLGPFGSIGPIFYIIYIWPPAQKYRIFPHFLYITEAIPIKWTLP